MEKIKALALIFASTIQEVGEIHSGTLYAMSMGHCTFTEYTAAIETLKEAKLVTETSYLLKWVSEN